MKSSAILLCASPLAGEVADDLRHDLVALVHEVKTADDGINLRLDVHPVIDLRITTVLP